jgi:hypothetical protein
MAPVALLIALLAGCGVDPARHDVETYDAAMKPVLARNLVLARSFLDIASRVKKGETDGPKIAEQMKTDVVPLADEVEASATKIQPTTPALADAHAILVKAWADRAESYHAMSDAWAKGDLAAFDAARKRNVQSKLDEEKYFQAANAVTSAYGVTIEQYP